MKAKTSIIALCMLVSASLSSCVWQLAEVVIRDSYPGSMPPKVIADVNGKPASSKLIPKDPEALPPPHNIANDKTPSYAPDGLPFSFRSKYQDVLISPYSPHNQLSYEGFQPGQKVWDPYTGKAFYIGRSYTVN